ncbi:MAG TPA: AbrB/MazE/SpoVT family DNA-binding domain-containing protein [Thermoplasmataceae archaeon]|nr:AbrB/MazE/SpoVT family DNA-binding domain-containing protein [Thermoplasmataceae archaeon]
MTVEIKGRELTATYRQGRLYIPKPFRDMFGLKDNDVLVIKIVEHSFNPTKRYRYNNRSGRKESDGTSEQSSSENKKDRADSLIDYTKPFELEEEAFWDQDDQ